MLMLNLCSGTGSVSKAFVRGGWEIVDVDWDPRHGPTHCVDIMCWECSYPPFFFDVVWCSPDCTQYSRARTTAKTPRNFDKADALVQKCLDLIDYLKPRLWFLENPDSGLLKTRSIMNDRPYVRLDYCMYGALYRKRTRIWTNAMWQPKLCDRSHLVDNKHVKRHKEVEGEFGIITILLIVTNCMLCQMRYVTKLSKFADRLEGNKQVISR